MPVRKTATESVAPTFMDPAFMPWVLVSELYWMSDKLLGRRLYDLGVSASQARVLAVLHYADEPIKPSAVATLLFQETQSITGILQRVEARGWVARTADPHDRRAVGLSLSAAGRKLSADVIAIMRELYEELFASALGALEQRQLESALRAVRAQGFKLPETDFKLRRARQYPIWND